QRRSSLPSDGALAGLMRDGLYAPELRYEHATTSTAPGHAALFTGLPPRGSGVFANERLDEVTGKPVSFFHDARARLVMDRAVDTASSSAASLGADTLADALRAQRPDAQIVALSLKDRASIPGGGRKPDAAVWFDPAREHFVTSTAFAEQMPAFVTACNAELERELRGSWQPLDARWLEQNAPTADAQAGEGDFGLGIRFPYHLSRADHRGVVFRGEPAADRAVLGLARAALAELTNDSQHDHPLLIVLSFSAFDYVGHVHGPDSWESWELLRELDGELKVFFAELDARFGERLGILLSADHGTTPLPETAGDPKARPWCGAATDDRYQRPCDKGERLLRDEIELRLRQVARRVLGAGNFVRDVVEPFAYWAPAVAALPSQRREALEKAAITDLEKHPGISRVLVSRRFGATCPPSSDESIEALVCRSLSDGAGDLYIVPKPGSFFDPSLVRAHGINHGSPYLYDRTVPLLLRTPRLASTGIRLDERLRPADFTATAAALLDIAPPSGAAGGRDLSKR
ncbi:MAG TPA: alkaline phosphatase family protein, partial [Polyangiaceae bacterium]|nr:alkaline phosphatase family protein [Polyangiaceae bacterium]